VLKLAMGVTGNPPVEFERTAVKREAVGIPVLDPFNSESYAIACGLVLQTGLRSFTVKQEAMFTFVMLVLPVAVVSPIASRAITLKSVPADVPKIRGIETVAWFLWLLIVAAIRVKDAWPCFLYSTPNVSSIETLELAKGMLIAVPRHTGNGFIVAKAKVDTTLLPQLLRLKGGDM